jgi:O-antigen ligase
VSLAVAVGVYYIFYSKQPLPIKLIKLTGIYFVALIVVVMVFLVLPETTAKGLTMKLTGEFVGVVDTDYTSGRLDLWTVALSHFIETPIFGTGWNTFVPLFGANSHSDYVLFLITTGIVGLFLFFRIYYRLFITVYQRRKRHTKYRHFIIAYLSGLASFIVAMLFVNIYNPSYFTMLYSALIIRLSMITTVESNAKHNDEFSQLADSSKFSPRISLQK